MFMSFSGFNRFLCRCGIRRELYRKKNKPGKNF